MNYYIECWKKYVEFSGRARRKEYWMFVLFNVIASFVAGVIDGVLGTVMIGSLYSLAALLPGLAVCARRLHDTDRSGWWMLIALIPVVGIIVHARRKPLRSQSEGRVTPIAVKCEKGLRQSPETFSCTQDMTQGLE